MASEPSPVVGHANDTAQEATAMTPAVSAKLLLTGARATARARTTTIINRFGATQSTCLMTYTVRLADNVLEHRRTTRGGRGGAGVTTKRTRATT